MQRKKRELSQSTDVHLVEKMPGETMGQLIERVRKEHALEQGKRLTFAGRLDPLASGLVLLLKGEERFNKESYLSLDKEYEFDLVLGVSTDTGDPLGKVLEVSRSTEPLHGSNKLEPVLNKFIGKYMQPYPLYSSRTVKGKPLFMYAREGKDVHRPTKEIEIYSLEASHTRSLSKTEYGEAVRKLVGSVSGDFRQREVLASLETSYEKLPSTFYIVRLVARVSSGTYVRVLAEKIAKELGTVGLAMNIRRTAIGGFTLEQSVV